MNRDNILTAIHTVMIGFIIARVTGVIKEKKVDPFIFLYLFILGTYYIIKLVKYLHRKNRFIIPAILTLFFIR